MKKLNFTISLIILAGLLYPSSCLAQQKIQPQTPTKTPQEVKLDITQSHDEIILSLEDCIKLSMQKNYNIKIVTTQANRNKWAYYNSLTSFLPNAYYTYTGTVAGGDFLITGLGSLNANFTRHSNIFTAEWPIFTGFRRYYDAQAAKNTFNATKKSQDLTVQKTILITTQNYYNLLQSKLNILILKKALEQTDEQLKINQERFEAGVGTKFDVLRGEAESAAAKQLVIQAENAYILAKAQLAYTIGIDLFTNIIPDESTTTAKTLLNEKLSLEEIAQIAIKNKPDIDIARFNLLTAKAKRNSQFSPYLPIVSLKGDITNISQAGSSFQGNRDLAITVNWTGLTGMGLTHYTNIKSKNEEVKESKLLLENTTRGVEQNIINSYYNSITTKELITVAQKQVDSAKESVRLAMVRQGAGVGIYTDVITAQLRETESKISLLNAIIGYNVAQTQLLYDMGIISPANVIEGYTPQKEQTPQTPPPTKISPKKKKISNAENKAPQKKLADNGNNIVKTANPTINKPQEKTMFNINSDSKHSTIPIGQEVKNK